jgi:hypothetical protein
MESQNGAELERDFPMRTLALLCVLLGSGCRSVPAGIVVVGSAYVETDRPEGKAVAKVEVQYRPPTTTPDVSLAANRKVPTTTGVALAEPVEMATRKCN